MSDNLKDKDFEEFYNKYSSLILNVAMKYLKDEYLAEDVMQEVMFKIYTNPEENEIESDSAWLTKITRNLSLNILKKMKYEYTSEDIGYLRDARSMDESELLNTETVYFHEKYEKELAELCDDVFKELTRKKYERWYQAVDALYRGEETQKETAIRMNMSENAFYAMLARIRGRMKKLYGSKYNGIEKA